MPRLKDGTIKRSRFTTLKIGELSSVDNPAQPGALAVCFKRDDACDDEITQKIWPFTDALTQSIRSAVGDTRLSGDEREAEIGKSVASFLSQVRKISEKDGPMPKSADELQNELTTALAKVDTLTQRAEKAETERDAAVNAQKAAETERDTAKADLVKATDETLKVGESEVKKSDVGDAQFAVLKGLADERDLARFEKRAETDYGHVVGKAEDKAKVLKAVDAIADEDTRKAFQAILDSAEKMAKTGFDMLGANRGPAPTEEQRTAKAEFDAKVAEIAKRDDCKTSEAMSKARRENPELFNKANGEAAASAQ